LPVKNEGLENIADSEKHQDSRHVSSDIPAAPKPALNEIEIEGVTYKVAISLCPGDDFGKDVVRMSFIWKILCSCLLPNESLSLTVSPSSIFI
jgi:hypothetical protein